MKNILIIEDAIADAFLIQATKRAFAANPEVRSSTALLEHLNIEKFADAVYAELEEISWAEEAKK